MVPAGRARDLIALYYYSPVQLRGAAAVKRTNTDYRNMDGAQSTGKRGLGANPRKVFGGRCRPG